MKTAIITFKNPAAEVDGGNIGTLAKTLFGGGFSADFLEILPTGDAASFRHSLERYKDVADNLIITDGKTTGFDLKEIICEVQGTSLSENENALRFAEAACPHGEESDAEKYAKLPEEASLIPNVYGAYQGFMLEDRDFTLMVLPEGETEYKQACEKYVLPYLEKKYNLKNKRLVLKYFGKREDLEKAVRRAEKVAGNGFRHDITERYGDFKISLLFEHYSEKGGAEAVRLIVGELKENLYAESDVSLSERLFDMLKLKNMRLSAAESFTGGGVISDMIKNPGASNVVYEGIVAYDNRSKERRLGVKRADLVREGAVSSIVAYEMAVGLLGGDSTDIAIATTGIAGPMSDRSDKPVGLCYIAVGMKDGVDTYRFNFKGSREEITETAKNTALFLALKKLKRI